MNVKPKPRQYINWENAPTMRIVMEAVEKLQYRLEGANRVPEHVKKHHGFSINSIHDRVCLDAGTFSRDQVKSALRRLENAGYVVKRYANGCNFYQPYYCGNIENEAVEKKAASARANYKPEKARIGGVAFFRKTPGNNVEPVTRNPF